MYLETGLTWDGWFTPWGDDQRRAERQTVLMIYDSVKDELKVRAH